MDWMSGDREYFSLWASLMAECIRNGVTIKIIHNVDRDGNEMVDAIRGWLPLYISGRIEPYVFRRERKPRFCHTLFLRPGGACIRGFSPADSGNERWYDYITDARHLDALRHEFENMLASASPFLLSDAPFRDIQIVTLGDAAAVLRCREPHTAFLCLNPVLTDSVSDYLSALIEQFSAERQPTIEALRNMQGERESEG